MTMTDRRPRPAPAPSRASRAQARLHAAVGLHDPLRPDRHRWRWRRGSSRPASTRSTPDGSPIPGTYQEVDSNPQRIVVDSLEAPINGLYGIEDPTTGNVDVFNSGELFGAIDVALFILVIGGFIGDHDEDRSDPGRHRPLVRTLRGRERWMIPILMTVFAIGGTTFGMAEESLAFYVLVITVMIAAGLRRPGRRARDPARLRHRRARLDRQPVRHRHRVGLRRRALERRARRCASSSSSSVWSIGHLVRAALRRAGAKRPDAARSCYDMKASQRGALRGRPIDEAGEVVLTGQHKVILGAVRRSPSP